MKHINKSTIAESGISGELSDNSARRIAPNRVQRRQYGRMTFRSADQMSQKRILQDLKPACSCALGGYAFANLKRTAPPNVLKTNVRIQQFVSRKSEERKRPSRLEVHGHYGCLCCSIGNEAIPVWPGNDRPGKTGTPIGIPRPVNSQVPISKIEYESGRPTWENPLAQMSRGIAIAEPEILNEIRERATYPMRAKTHFKDLGCRDWCNASVFCPVSVFFSHSVPPEREQLFRLSLAIQIAALARLAAG